MGLGDFLNTTIPCFFMPLFSFTSNYRAANYVRLLGIPIFFLYRRRDDWMKGFMHEPSKEKNIIVLSDIF